MTVSTVPSRTEWLKQILYTLWGRVGWSYPQGDHGQQGEKTCNPGFQKSRTEFPRMDICYVVLTGSISEWICCWPLKDMWWFARRRKWEKVALAERLVGKGTAVTA